MEKYYANREMAYPFNLVYRMGMEMDSIERKDFLDELFGSLLFELESRIGGANHLLKQDVSSKLDKDYIEEDDEFIFENFEDDEDIIYDKRCQVIALKRMEALQTFHDAIEILYKMFYNSNVKDLEKLIQKHERGW